MLAENEMLRAAACALQQLNQNLSLQMFAGTLGQAELGSNREVPGSTYFMC